MSFIAWLIAIATLLPLAGSVVNIVVGRRFGGDRAGWFATGVMTASFVLALIASIQWVFGSPEPEVLPIKWLPIGGGKWLSLGLLVDSLGVAMVTMVSLIAALVHLYSIGYMRGDSRVHWFFGYLSLFSFSMLGIVTSHSLMQLFVFWELVGLTSYLLIGFWFEKRGPRLACRKAFVMNRIGDTGFLIGFGILFYKLGGNVLLPACEGVGDPKLLSMLGMLTAPASAGGLGIDILNPPIWLTAAGIALFVGAMGKSAQFPLHTWLPDAMEGPTPVSSIVHSATMVAAGVYLTGRIYPILTPGAHLFVATIGLVTLVMAACMALVMTDIKRVLAYSTLSQLGYMVLALGAGAYTFALFHLITHAFFKCCLFQCAGSVIHGAHHQQDMRYYGGLKDKLPTTMWCYAVCTLAISGAALPFTMLGLSGFYSKDGIIAGTMNYGHMLGGWANLFWIGPLVIAYVTPFYMARSFALTFLGKPRDQHLYDHAKEAPWTMLVPQAILAVLAVFAAVLPFQSLINQSLTDMKNQAVTWVQPGSIMEMHLSHLKLDKFLLFGFAWILCLAAGIFMYKDGFRYSSRIVKLPVISQLYTWSCNKFYFDAFYDRFVVAVGLIMAWITNLFDGKIVDKLVDLCGLGGRAAAWLTRIFDEKVVDRAVDGTATFTHQSGGMLRSTQGGRIRAYVMLLFAFAAVTLVVLLAVMKTAL